MFPLPYPAPYSTLLYVLFGLDLALLGGGLVLGRYDAAKLGRLPLAVRIALSAILFLAALLQCLRGGALAGGYPLWIVVAMAAGLSGDLLLAGLVRIPRRREGDVATDRLNQYYDPAVWARMALALGALDLGVALHMLDRRPTLAVWVAAVLVAAGLWYRFVYSPGGDALNLSALMCGFFVASMGALAISLAAHERRFLPLALGGALLLASDLMLGNWRIRGHKWRGVNDVIWVTDNLGQLLIVYSIAAALNAAPLS